MSHSLMRYHPSIGYTYMPNAKLRLPWGNGGYLVRANAAGFRSDREFVPQRRPGVFRALVFGDSQTAGDGVANAQRYTELLEKAVPGFELYNYSISGTGPDQQYLTYQEQTAVERDLLIIPLYVENIRRVGAWFYRSRDGNGEEYIRAKPYFLIERDELVLHHVPVPKQPWTVETFPAEMLPHCYMSQALSQGNTAAKVGRNFVSMARKYMPKRLTMALKNLAMRSKRFRPLPEFDRADNPSWVLLRRMLHDWIRASPTPALVIPIPHHFFLSSPRDARPYQARFSELADASGCHLYDPLPDFLRLPAEQRAALWSDSSGHVSIRGHEILAGLLAPVVQKLMAAGAVRPQSR